MTIDMNDVEFWIKENLFFGANHCSVTMAMIETMTDEELLHLANEMGYFNSVNLN